jgi:hypothetical protein
MVRHGACLQQGPAHKTRDSLSRPPARPPASRERKALESFFHPSLSISTIITLLHALAILFPFKESLILKKTPNLQRPTYFTKTASTSYKHLLKLHKTSSPSENFLSLLTSFLPPNCTKLQTARTNPNKKEGKKNSPRRKADLSK